MALLCLGSEAQVVLFNGLEAPSTGGFNCQDFETLNDAFDSYGADDFIVPAGETWWVDSIRLYGFYSSGALEESGVIISIYEDSAGSLGSLVMTDTMTFDVDENGDGWLTPSWNTPIQLTADTYWLVGAAKKDFGGGGGQWYWFRDSNTVAAYEAMWSNPGNGFASGCTGFTSFSNCTALNTTDEGFLFRVYGCYGPTKPNMTGVSMTRSSVQGTSRI